MTSHDGPTYSEGDLRNRNRYLREFLPFMAAYGIVLVAVLTTVEPDAAAAPALYLLPVVPLFGAFWAYYRQIKRADEYSMLIQVKAMAIGFASALLASLMFGFLSLADVVVAWSPWVIAGAAFIACFGSLGVLARD